MASFTASKEAKDSLVLCRRLAGHDRHMHTGSVKHRAARHLLIVFSR